MTKKEMMQLMQVLSALESWGFCNQQRIPDYLPDRLLQCVEVLEREILNESK
jgi:hypothetical protein